TWPKVRRIAHIHPDYSYGRNAFAHFNIVMKKMVPGAQVVSEGWPKLGTTDFTSHITKAIAAKPDLLVASVWGGDYVAMYKQALRYDMFKKMKFTSMIAFSVNSPDYPFQILDPNRIITIPIRNITAPPGWPAPSGEDTRTYTWIDKTWPTVKL